MTRDLTAEEIEQYADGELADDAIAAHVRQCARCATAVLDVMQMKRAIGAFPRFQWRTADHGRRGGGGRRSSAVFANATRDGGATLVPWLAAAAVMALLIISGYLAAARNAARELVDLHTTIVGSASPVDVVSTDKHTVKPWFEGRVPFAVDVPQLQGDFRLVGGKVVFWRGMPVAYMLVTKGAHRVSVFASQAGIEPHFAAMAMQSWKRNGVTYTAVADLSPADLDRLREAFLRQP